MNRLLYHREDNKADVSSVSPRSAEGYSRSVFTIADCEEKVSSGLSPY